MDVDVPSKDAIQFSADNLNPKGKVVADLPVEAEDNLPWYGCNDTYCLNWMDADCPGLKNTDPTRWAMSLGIRIFSPRLTDSSNPMCAANSQSMMFCLY